MPLVYAAVVPHTPLLIPSIGKERRDEMAHTLNAIAAIRDHLTQNAIETLIILAPHAPSTIPAFQLQHDTTFTASFEEFGDIVTTKSYQPSHILIDYLKHHFDGSAIPWVYHTDDHLEYAASVPLITLGIEAGLPIAVIYPPFSESLPELARTGVGLYDALASYPRRVALLASGDLAHTLSEDAPGGYHKDAKKFDRRVIATFEKKESEKLLKTTPEMIDAIKVCSVPTLAVLSGVLKHLSYEPRTISYEAPLGVGHLVMEYII